MYHYDLMMAQALGRNVSLLNEHIHKSVSVVSGDSVRSLSRIRTYNNVTDYMVIHIILQHAYS